MPIHEHHYWRGKCETCGAIDRYADLLKQGFMKPIRRGRGTKKPKVEQPIVSCEDCLNWHRKGKHTASATERKANREARRLREKSRAAVSR